MTSVAIICPYNSQAVFEANLNASSIANDPHIECLIEEGHKSAGRAYNSGLAKTHADIAILAHQDVYFPANWHQRLLEAIEYFQFAQEPWAVLGVWGVCHSGRFVGRVYCNGGKREHVGDLAHDAYPTEVVSIDEVVIVLNRKRELRFDENLPGYHLYATDVILQARNKGWKTFVFHAPVVHNSRCNPRAVDLAYVKAYRYMQRKWKAILPLKTCVVPITRSGWPLYRYIARREMRLLLHGKPSHIGMKPGPYLARQLGYE